MTFYLLDVASYQGDLKPVDVVRAGFDAVNLKVSHGLTRKAVHPNVTGWAEQARTLTLGVSTFHWLTADAPGEAQAEFAYQRIAELGLADGTAHQLDVEAVPVPTLGQVRSYLIRMTELLGRPVAVYTGDWWWTARPGWDVSDLSPYLWSAPSDGYPGSYPGDASAKWSTVDAGKPDGYGGWRQLMIMQYAVQPLTFGDGTRGTIKVSKSAIRNPAVWRDLTLGRPGMSYAPDSLKMARRLYIDTLKLAGYNINPASVGIVGDDAHAASGTSYHLGKDALKANSYSVVESPRDRSGLTNAAAGLDLGWFSITVKGKTHNLRSFSGWLVAQCRAGAADTLDIREVIYSPDGNVVKRWDRLGRRSTGDRSHTTHTHVSYFRDSENRDKTALLRRYFTEIGLLEGPAGSPPKGDDMPLTDDDVRKLATADVWPAPPALGVADGTISLQDFMTRIFNRAEAANNTVSALRTAFMAFAAAEQGDDATRAQALAQLQADLQAVPGASAEAVFARLGDDGQSDAEIASLLRAALGDRAAQVGAILADGGPAA